MRYLSPERLLQQVHAEKREFSALELFTRAGAKYTLHREKWCAAVFSAGYEQHVGACEVRMNDAAQADDADFFLRTARGVFPFQITEVIEPERRRGDEYRRANGKVTHFDPIGVERAGELIRTAVERKVAKNYGAADSLNVLLYINVGVFGMPFDALIQAAMPQAERFRSCWAITSQMIACIHSDVTLGALSAPGWGEVK